MHFLDYNCNGNGAFGMSHPPLASQGVIFNLVSSRIKAYVNRPCTHLQLSYPFDTSNNLGLSWPSQSHLQKGKNYEVIKFLQALWQKVSR